MGETLICQRKKTQILQGSSSEFGSLVAGARLRIGNLKPLPVWIDHPSTDRVLGQFCHAKEAKLVQQVGPVDLDRLDADAELLVNLPVRAPFGNQLQHVSLAGGQSLETVRP